MQVKDKEVEKLMNLKELSFFKVFKFFSFDDYLRILDEVEWPSDEKDKQHESDDF
jgi:hypothetical protein